MRIFWPGWLVWGVAVLVACGVSPTTPRPTPYPTLAVAPTATDDASTRVPADAECAIAYAYGDSLFCLGWDGTPLRGDGVPRPIATAELVHTPRIASDGKWVAYVAVQGGQAQLWAAAFDGSAQKPLAENLLPHAFAWQPGSHWLWFNTEVNGNPNADLWTVNVDSGEIKPILPAQTAQAFGLSPDGTLVALLQPERVSVLEVASQQVRANLSLPGTQAQMALQWRQDSQALWLAVPAADQTMTLYQMDLNGPTQVRGTLHPHWPWPATLAGQFAPDGQWALYAARTATGPQLRLYALATATETALTEVEQATGWGWAANAQTYAYTNLSALGPGGLYIIHPSAAPELVTPGLTAVGDVRWLGNDALVFYGRLNGGDWGLYLQRLGAETRLLVSGLLETVTVDAR